MDEWLDIPIDPTRVMSMPTWEVFAERYDRCVRRLVFYVGQRICDRASRERIVIDVLRHHLDLLVDEHDELGEFRSLKKSADDLIRRVLASPRGLAACDGSCGPTSRSLEPGSLDFDGPNTCIEGGSSSDWPPRL